MRSAARLAAVLAISAAAAQAQEAWSGADILVLGEVHDNPDHHLLQARIVAATSPSALVFEMLSPAQALAAVGVDRADAGALGAAFGWEASGWPDFALYAPVFAAAPDAALFGAAVPPDVIEGAMDLGAAASFGPEAALFGLTPLAPEDRADREAEQAAAHCGALPATLLGGMVEVQRLRDATFARVAVQALDALGGPVVVITGTGHARTDRGVPAAIRTARPELVVWALGQVESVAPGAPFDAINVTEPPARPDPCLAFQ